jgi:hypothetical protein
MTSTTSSFTPTFSPNSPPGLSGSKSSKSSSSFKSSRFEHDGILSDITNFEDIGLHDDGDVVVSPAYGKSQSLEQRMTPGLKQMNFAQAHAGQSQIGVNGNGNENTRGERSMSPPSRDLTFKKRPTYPSMTPQMSMIVGEQTHGRPSNRRTISRGLVSSSTPSLPMSNNPRARTPSPKSSLQSTFTAKNSASSLKATRRSSWQPNRKTAEELEAEYDDLDEDLPDDSVLWNVPISPRPPFPMSPASDSSHATFSPNINNPSSFFPDQSRQTISPVSTIPDNTNIPSSRSHSQHPPSPPQEHEDHDYNRPRPVMRGITMSSFPVTPLDPNLTPKPRAKSYSTAHNALGYEAQILTEVLEAHAEFSGLPQPQKNESMLPKMRKNGSVELPPIQRGNGLIDPLPVSKEKEKVLTRTRPSWLPPKSKAEEKRHLKEYQRMVAQSLEAGKFDKVIGSRNVLTPYRKEKGRCCKKRSREEGQHPGAHQPYLGNAYFAQLDNRNH